MTARVTTEELQPGLFLDEWSELARGSAAGVFATPEWHMAVQKSYGDRGRATVLACRESGQLVGVVPLRLSTRRWIRSAALLGMGEGGYGLGDYGGIVAAPGREGAIAEATIHWLADHGGWDLLDLQQLPPGPIVRSLVEAARHARFRTLIRHHNLCHVIELPGTWAEYRSRLSPGARDWLERKPRKAERELGAKVEMVVEDDTQDEYARMRRFQAARFGDQPARPERKLAVVIGEWLSLAHNRDWLRMFRLRTEARTVGVLLGYEYENAFYFHSAAFESHDLGARYSLGASLLAAALRFSIMRGLGRFDMLRGHYDYKARLGSVMRPNYRVVVFRDSMVGRALETALGVRTLLKGKRAWQTEPESWLIDEPRSEGATSATEHLAGAAVGIQE